ncbi:hydroxyacid dehydrogenase [Achromobacter aloeverae]
MAASTEPGAGPGIILCTQAPDDYATRRLSAYGSVVVAPDLSEAGLVKLAPKARAIVVRGQTHITKAVIDAAPGLQVIGRTGVGYDMIDVAAAAARGVPVVYTPGVGARAVAEGSMAFMLSLCKMLPYWDAELKAGNWASRFGLQAGDLAGHTLGIVGLGRIGGLVARMARVFEMDVIAYSPTTPVERAREHHAELVPLDELMRRSHFIALHCPYTKETHGLIDRARLALVQEGTMLVNLSRGGVVESLDLLDEMLETGRLGGVALDVFEPEPPDTSHPIFRRRNCITSPHTMGTTKGAWAAIMKSMADDMAAVMDGAAPRHQVSLGGRAQ